MFRKNNGDDNNKAIKEANRFSSIKASINEKKIVIIALLAVCAVFSLLFWSVYNQSYTATILIYPDQLSNAGLLTGNSESEVNSAIGAYTIPFDAYPALLRSPEVQKEVLQRDYTIKFEFKSYSIDLTRYFAMKNISYALQELNNITDISLLDNSGILRLSVTTRYPDLSRQIAEAYMDGLKKQLDQLRHEKISENIDQLDRALQFIETKESLSDSTREDLISRLQNKKELYILASELNPAEPGVVREGYTRKNGIFSKTIAASAPLIFGFAAVLVVLGLELRKSSRKCKAYISTSRVNLKRKPETLPSQIRQKPASRTTRKTSTGKKPQKGRAVKV